MRKDHTRKTVLSIALALIGAVAGSPFVQAMAELPEEKAAMLKVCEHFQGMDESTIQLMLLSRARVDVSQTHRFPKLLQVPRQMLGVRALLVFEPEDKVTLRFFRRVFLNLLNRCIPRRLAILVLLDVPG